MTDARYTLPGLLLYISYITSYGLSQYASSCCVNIPNNYNVKDALLVPGSMASVNPFSDWYCTNPNVLYKTKESTGITSPITNLGPCFTSEERAMTQDKRIAIKKNPGNYFYPDIPNPRRAPIHACLAGYDGEIFEIIKDIKETSGNEIEIHFYLFHRCKFNLLESHMTTVKSLQDVLAKFHHYICLNKKYVDTYNEKEHCWYIEKLIMIPSFKRDFESLPKHIRIDEFNKICGSNNKKVGFEPLLLEIDEKIDKDHEKDLQQIKECENKCEVSLDDINNLCEKGANVDNILQKLPLMQNQNMPCNVPCNMPCYGLPCHNPCNIQCNAVYNKPNYEWWNPCNTPRNIPRNNPCIAANNEPTINPCMIPCNAPYNELPSYPCNFQCSLPNRNPCNLPWQTTCNKPCNLPKDISWSIPYKAPCKNPYDVPYCLTCSIPWTVPCNFPCNAPSRLPWTLPYNNPYNLHWKPLFNLPCKFQYKLSYNGPCKSQNEQERTKNLVWQNSQIPLSPNALNTVGNNAAAVSDSRNKENNGNLWNRFPCKCATNIWNVCNNIKNDFKSGVDYATNFIPYKPVNVPCVPCVLKNTIEEMNAIKHTVPHIKEQLSSNCLMNLPFQLVKNIPNAIAENLPVKEKANINTNNKVNSIRTTAYNPCVGQGNLVNKQQNNHQTAVYTQRQGNGYNPPCYTASQTSNQNSLTDGYDTFSLYVPHPKRFGPEYYTTNFKQPMNKFQQGNQLISPFTPCPNMLSSDKNKKAVCDTVSSYTQPPRSIESGHYTRSPYSQSSTVSPQRYKSQNNVPPGQIQGYGTTICYTQPSKTVKPNYSFATAFESSKVKLNEGSDTIYANPQSVCNQGYQIMTPYEKNGKNLMLGFIQTQNGMPSQYKTFETLKGQKPTTMLSYSSSQNYNEKNNNQIVLYTPAIRNENAWPAPICYSQQIARKIKPELNVISSYITPTSNSLTSENNNCFTPLTDTEIEQNSVTNGNNEIATYTQPENIGEPKNYAQSENEFISPYSQPCSRYQFIPSYSQKAILSPDKPVNEINNAFNSDKKPCRKSQTVSSGPFQIKEKYDEIAEYTQQPKIVSSVSQEPIEYGKAFVNFNTPQSNVNSDYDTTSITDNLTKPGSLNGVYAPESTYRTVFSNIQKGKICWPHALVVYTPHKGFVQAVPQVKLPQTSSCYNNNIYVGNLQRTSLAWPEYQIIPNIATITPNQNVEVPQFDMISSYGPTQFVKPVSYKPEIAYGSIQKIGTPEIETTASFEPSHKTISSELNTISIGSTMQNGQIDNGISGYFQPQNALQREFDKISSCVPHKDPDVNKIKSYGSPCDSGRQDIYKAPKDFVRPEFDSWQKYPTWTQNRQIQPYDMNSAYTKSTKEITSDFDIIDSVISQPKEEKRISGFVTPNEQSGILNYSEIAPSSQTTIASDFNVIDSYSAKQENEEQRPTFLQVPYGRQPCYDSDKGYAPTKNNNQQISDNFPAYTQTQKTKNEDYDGIDSYTSRPQGEFPVTVSFNMQTDAPKYEQLDSTCSHTPSSKTVRPTLHVEDYNIIPSYSQKQNIISPDYNVISSNEKLPFSSVTEIGTTLPCPQIYSKQNQLSPLTEKATTLMSLIDSSTNDEKPAKTSAEYLQSNMLYGIKPDQQSAIPYQQAIQPDFNVIDAYTNFQKDLRPGYDTYHRGLPLVSRIQPLHTHVYRPSPQFNTKTLHKPCQANLQPKHDELKVYKTSPLENQETVISDHKLFTLHSEIPQAFKGKYDLIKSTRPNTPQGFDQKYNGISLFKPSSESDTQDYGMLSKEEFSNIPYYTSKFDNEPISSNFNPLQTSYISTAQPQALESQPNERIPKHFSNIPSYTSSPNVVPNEYGTDTVYIQNEKSVQPKYEKISVYASPEQYTTHDHGTVCLHQPAQRIALPLTKITSYAKPTKCGSYEPNSFSSPPYLSSGSLKYDTTVANSQLSYIQAPEYSPCSFPEQAHYDKNPSYTSRSDDMKPEFDEISAYSPYLSRKAQNVDYTQQPVCTETRQKTNITPNSQFISSYSTKPNIVRPIAQSSPYSLRPSLIRPEIQRILSYTQPLNTESETLSIPLNTYQPTIIASDFTKIPSYTQLPSSVIENLYSGPAYTQYSTVITPANNQKQTKIRQEIQTIPSYTRQPPSRRPETQKPTIISSSYNSIPTYTQETSTIAQSPVSSPANTGHTTILTPANNATYQQPSIISDQQPITPEPQMTPSYFQPSDVISNSPFTPSFTHKPTIVTSDFSTITSYTQSPTSIRQESPSTSAYSQQPTTATAVYNKNPVNVSPESKVMPCYHELSSNVGPDTPSISPYTSRPSQIVPNIQNIPLYTQPSSIESGTQSTPSLAHQPTTLTSDFNTIPYSPTRLIQENPLGSAHTHEPATVTATYYKNPMSVRPESKQISSCDRLSYIGPQKFISSFNSNPSPIGIETQNIPSYNEPMSIEPGTQCTPSFTQQPNIITSLAQNGDSTSVFTHAPTVITPDTKPKPSSDCQQWSKEPGAQYRQPFTQKPTMITSKYRTTPPLIQRPTIKIESQTTSAHSQQSMVLTPFGYGKSMNTGSKFQLIPNYSEKPIVLQNQYSQLYYSHPSSTIEPLVKFLPSYYRQTSIPEDLTTPLNSQSSSIDPTTQPLTSPSKQTTTVSSDFGKIPSYTQQARSITTVIDTTLPIMRQPTVTMPTFYKNLKGIQPKLPHSQTQSQHIPSYNQKPTIKTSGFDAVPPYLLNPAITKTETQSVPFYTKRPCSTESVSQSRPSIIPNPYSSKTLTQTLPSFTQKPWSSESVTQFKPPCNLQPCINGPVTQSLPTYTQQPYINGLAIQSIPSYNQQPYINEPFTQFISFYTKRPCISGPVSQSMLSYMQSPCIDEPVTQTIPSNTQLPNINGAVTQSIPCYTKRPWSVPQFIPSYTQPPCIDEPDNQFVSTYTQEPYSYESYNQPPCKNEPVTASIPPYIQQPCKIGPVPQLIPSYTRQPYIRGPVSQYLPSYYTQQPCINRPDFQSVPSYAQKPCISESCTQSGPSHIQQPCIRGTVPQSAPSYTQRPCSSESVTQSIPPYTQRPSSFESYAQSIPSQQPCFNGPLSQSVPSYTQRPCFDGPESQLTPIYTQQPCINTAVKPSISPYTQQPRINGPDIRSVPSYTQRPCSFETSTQSLPSYIQRSCNNGLVTPSISSYTHRPYSSESVTQFEPPNAQQPCINEPDTQSVLSYTQRPCISESFTQSVPSYTQRPYSSESVTQSESSFTQQPCISRTIPQSTPSYTQQPCSFESSAQSLPSYIQQPCINGPESQFLPPYTQEPSNMGAETQFAPLYAQKPTIAMTGIQSTPSYSQRPASVTQEAQSLSAFTPEPTTTIKNFNNLPSYPRKPICVKPIQSFLQKPTDAGDINLITSYTKRPQTFEELSDTIRSQTKPETKSFGPMKYYMRSPEEVKELYDRLAAYSKSKGLTPNYNPVPDYRKSYWPSIGPSSKPITNVKPKYDEIKSYTQNPTVLDLNHNKIHQNINPYIDNIDTEEGNIKLHQYNQYPKTFKEAYNTIASYEEPKSQPYENKPSYSQHNGIPPQYISYTKQPIKDIKYDTISCYSDEHAKPEMDNNELNGNTRSYDQNLKNKDYTVSYEQPIRNKQRDASIRVSYSEPNAINVQPCLPFENPCVPYVQTKHSNVPWLPFRQSWCGKQYAPCVPTEKPCSLRVPTEKTCVPYGQPREQTRQPCVPIGQTCVISGEPYVPCARSEQPRMPCVPSEQPCMPCVPSEQPCMPCTPSIKPCIPCVQTEQPYVGIRQPYVLTGEPCKGTRWPCMPCKPSRQPCIPCLSSEQTSVPCIPSGQPCVPCVSCRPSCVPCVPPGKPCMPCIMPGQPCLPCIPPGQPCVPYQPSEQSSAPWAPPEQPSVPYVPSGQPCIPRVPSSLPCVACLPSEHSNAPWTTSEQPSVPYVPSGQPCIPCVPSEQPCIPCVPSRQPCVPYLPSEHSSAPWAPSGQSSIPWTQYGQPGVPCVSCGQPCMPCLSFRQPCVPCLSSKQTNLPCAPSGQPCIPCIPRGKPCVPCVPCVPSEQPCMPFVPSGQPCEPCILSGQPCVPCVPCVPSGQPCASCAPSGQPCIPCIPCGQPCVPSEQPCVPCVPSKQPCMPCVPSGQPCAPCALSGQPCMPCVSFEQPCVPCVPSGQTCVPCLPSEKSSAPWAPSEQPCVPCVSCGQPYIPCVPSRQPCVSCMPSEQPCVPCVSFRQPCVPCLSSEQTNLPWAPSGQPCIPCIPCGQPCVPSEQPCVPCVPSKQPCMPCVPSGQPCAPCAISGQPCMPYVSSGQPCMPCVSSEKPCMPCVPSGQICVPCLPSEKSSAPWAPSEQPCIPCVSCEQPYIPCVPSRQPCVSCMPSEQPCVPCVSSRQPYEPCVRSEQSSVPWTPYGQPCVPCIPSGQPCMPCIPCGQPCVPCVPCVPSEQPCMPCVASGQPCVPCVPSGQPCAPCAPSGQQYIPYVSSGQPCMPCVSSEQPCVPCVPSGQPCIPCESCGQPCISCVPSEQPCIPCVPSRQPCVPYLPSEHSSAPWAQSGEPYVPSVPCGQPCIPCLPSEQSSTPCVSCGQPCIPCVPSEQPCVPCEPSGQPCVPCALFGQACVPCMSFKQPCVPCVQSEQPCVPRVPSRQPCESFVPSGQPCVPYVSTEQPYMTSVRYEQPHIPCVSSEQPSYPCVQHSRQKYNSIPSYFQNTPVKNTYTLNPTIKQDKYDKQNTYEQLFNGIMQDYDAIALNTPKQNIITYDLDQICGNIQQNDIMNVTNIDLQSLVDRLKQCMMNSIANANSNVKNTPMPIGNIVIAKTNFKDQTPFFSKVIDKNVKLQGFMNKVKVLKAKLVVEADEIEVPNFIPIVKCCEHREPKIIQDMAANIVKSVYNKPVLLIMPCNEEQSFVVMKNVGMSKNNALVWPAVCENNEWYSGAGSCQQGFQYERFLL